MKVMCINEGKYTHDFIPKLEVGNVYTVKRADVTEETQGDTIYVYHGFVLNEMGEPYAYGTALFAPLSDIDEKEMVRNLQTETA